MMAAMHQLQLPPATGTLVLWLNSDCLGLANNTAVANWADGSGYNNSGSQANSTKQPVCYTLSRNGHSSVNFPGGGTRVLNCGNSTSLNLPTGMTGMVVANCTGADSGDNAWFLFKNADFRAAPPYTNPPSYGLGVMNGNGAQGFPYTVGGSWADHTGNGTPSKKNAWHLFTYIFATNANFSASNWTMRLDGAQTNTGNTAGNITNYTGQLQVGAYDVTSWGPENMTGNIAEIKLWNVALTGANLTSQENILRAKYSL